MLISFSISHSRYIRCFGLLTAIFSDCFIRSTVLHILCDSKKGVDHHGRRNYALLSLNALVRQPDAMTTSIRVSSQQRQISHLYTSSAIPSYYFYSISIYIIHLFCESFGFLVSSGTLIDVIMWMFSLLLFGVFQSFVWVLSVGKVSWHVTCLCCKVFITSWLSFSCKKMVVSRESSHAEAKRKVISKRSALAGSELLDKENKDFASARAVLAAGSTVQHWLRCFFRS